MNRTLERVAILGAGSMGSQIAAHFANAGIPSLLLDLPSQGASKNALVEQQIAALKKRRPAPLYSTDDLHLIQAGNFEDDLHRVGECGWILEAVVEDLEIKRQLLQRVEEHRRPGTIVSTNTSGLSVDAISRDRSPDFRRHWLGVHFFNPPRYMKLVELIPTTDTEPYVVETVRIQCDRLLGKGVVVAKDRPNFIANRIGTFVAGRAMELMVELGLSIEEVDALTGAVLGRPKLGTFGVADLVGIDLLVKVLENLYLSLPDDPWRHVFQPPDFLKEMVRRGWLGRKAGQGFYKKSKKGILVLDVPRFEYRSPAASDFPSLSGALKEEDPGRRLEILIGSGDKSSAFLWPYLRDTLLYSAQRIPEICAQFYEIDRAMRWGFNWEWGPFELWDRAGFEAIAGAIETDGQQLPDWVRKLLSHGTPRLYVAGRRESLYYDPVQESFQPLAEDSGKISLSLLKRREEPVLANSEASLIDIGDGVACLQFHSKLNSIGPGTLELARESLEKVKDSYLGLVIGNQGSDFSVGANLALLLQKIQAGAWGEIEAVVKAFQDLTGAIRRSPCPVVAAPFQRVLGGATELCLGCHHIVASAETYMGLVEVGVGLIPAGGGCKEMIRRCSEGRDLGRESERVAVVREAFETIATARVSRSAREAEELHFLRKGDSIEIHPDRLLSRAKKKVLEAVRNGCRPSERLHEIPVSGEAGQAYLKIVLHQMQLSKRISKYDVEIGRHLARILCGGDLNHPAQVSEDYLLSLEREAFLHLCGQTKTRHRIEAMLKTGKPLRN